MDWKKNIQVGLKNNMPITPYTLFQSTMIIMGVWYLSKLTKMCYYQWVYGGTGGKDYLDGKLKKEYL